MNERVHTSIKVIEKIFCTLAIRSLGKHYFLRSFANGIKNDKMSSEIHIIVCLLKTE